MDWCECCDYARCLIADGSIIGSNAVVTKTLTHLPAVIVGIPARVIRYL